jgi:glycosidase
LIYGTTWLGQHLISASEEATIAEMYGNQLVLNQPISRAEAGANVEMIGETLFSAWERESTVVLKIERGDIGFTELEFSRYVGGDWVVVKTFSWGGITGDGRNEFSIKIPVDQLFGETFVSSAPSWQEMDIESVGPVTGMPQGTDGFDWWNDSVFYEIYVRSFYDSDGDGIGDLNGITQKLDYLNDGDSDTSTDLGITGLWLMPIYSSPTNHGYNVTDFFTVDPEYGTMDDLFTLLDAAHARGIRVILDISLNVTSNQHPWFINAGNPASPYHDWYIWADDDPGYTGSWGQQVWFPYKGRYFYSTYSAYSPDLNLTNPEVTEKLQEVVRFWLQDVGVDGFRLDSAKHMIEEGSIQENTASTHAWWESLRPFYKQINPQAVTVAEVWDNTYITAEYLQGDEVDLSFEFNMAGTFINAVNSGNSNRVKEQIELSYSLIPPLQFASFLTNHDMDRLMTQLNDSPAKVNVAASLLLTAPGVPFLYYGEEIGLQGQRPDVQNRLPMQWSADQFAGFSTGSPWASLGPDWENFNVAAETGDQASMLSHFRNLIQARNQHAALRVGDLSVVTSSDSALYSILRVSQEEAVLVLINLTAKPLIDYQLALEDSRLAEGSYTPIAILGKGVMVPLSTNSNGGFFQYVPVPVVPPYATFIIQLQRNIPDA